MKICSKSVKKAEIYIQTLLALVDGSSRDSHVFFFNQGPKTGEIHHDQNVSNRGYQQEEEE